MLRCVIRDYRFFSELVVTYIYCKAKISHMEKLLQLSPRYWNAVVRQYSIITTDLNVNKIRNDIVFYKKFNEGPMLFPFVVFYRKKKRN